MSNLYGPMLNAYPDSIGGTLDDIVTLLSREETKDAFASFYILPSLFNTDLDRGFSVIDYGINRQLASEEALQKLQALGIKLKLDFILNHLSVLSPQFQDILKNGDNSRYRDFFIDWNRFWEGCGEMTAEGYIQPRPEYLEKMFFRKPGLPILMVRFPDGREVPYWNTFYQQVRYPRLEAEDLMEEAALQYSAAAALAADANRQLDGGLTPSGMDFDKLNGYKDTVVSLLERRRRYLGQMDLNIRSPLIWEYYDETLKRLADYGADIVRLDAFAYAPKEPGARNFMNDPGTWDLLDRVRALADRYGVTLLPEIHASYAEAAYKLLASKGYMVYDFFLPGLLLHALDTGDTTYLYSWAQELLRDNIRTVNMLGCHDGIPVLDLKGLLPEDEIDALIARIVARGGMIKNLHGQKKMYYQVNATYFSALGADGRKLLLARALQLFMPGKPQIWYLDLFAGENDLEAVRRAGPGGHKEINRTNLSPALAEEKLHSGLTLKQLELLRFRNAFPAFDPEADISVEMPENGRMRFIWRHRNCEAVLDADCRDFSFRVTGLTDGNGTFTMVQ